MNNWSILCLIKTGTDENNNCICSYLQYPTPESNTSNVLIDHKRRTRIVLSRVSGKCCVYGSHVLQVFMIRY